MDVVLTKLKQKSEADVKRFLNAEIRYRKVTTLNVKEGNYIFRQMNITQEKKTSNLRILLQNSSLTLAATATMNDLSSAIKQHGVPTEDPELDERETVTSEALNEDKSDTVTLEALNEEKSDTRVEPEEQIKDLNESEVGVQDLKEGEMIAANFDDGFWLGEVIEISSTNIHISFM